jgi:hypothetical protein
MKSKPAAGVTPNEARVAALQARLERLRERIVKSLRTENRLRGRLRYKFRQDEDEPTEIRAIMDRLSWTLSCSMLGEDEDAVVLDVLINRETGPEDGDDGIDRAIDNLIDLLEEARDRLHEAAAATETAEVGDA